MEEKLLNLYARLVREAERCNLYGLRAEKEERHDLATLFRALALSHSMQARRFLMQIRGSVSDSTGNIDMAFTVELPAFIADYEMLMAEAEAVDSKALASGFRQSAGIQRMNTNLYQQLSSHPGRHDYYVCDFCGFVAADSPPKNCPICTAPQKRFVGITF